MTIRSHSTADVADLMMGCSERWLIEQLRANRFPGCKVGRHWRMTDKDVEDALGICANDARRNAATAGEIATDDIRPVVALTPTSRKRVGRLNDSASEPRHQGGSVRSAGAVVISDARRSGGNRRG